MKFFLSSDNTNLFCCGDKFGVLLDTAKKNKIQFGWFYVVCCFLCFMAARCVVCKQRGTAAFSIPH